VTFEHAAQVLAPDAAGTDAVLSRAGDLELLLGRAAVRAGADDGPLTFSPADQHAFARDRSPVLWSDLAFESGVLLVYPGNTFFPVGYDPRKREWYASVVGTHGHRWGSPYPDATSGALLLPCSVALYDDGGAFVGVAAEHLALDGLLASLTFDGVDGFRGWAILDAQGQVVLSTSERGWRTDPGLHDNRALVRTPFPVDEVRGAIAHGASDGIARSGDALVVYQRLDMLDWSLAITVAAAAY
jgi:hypothetical protein